MAIRSRRGNVERSQSIVIYPFPWQEFLSLSRDLVSDRRRDLGRDATSMWARASAIPIVEGESNIPAHGRVLIAANHYQRRGLWIAWAGALITQAVAHRRNGVAPCWLVTGELRLLQWRNTGPCVPGTRRLFRRVAKVYDMEAVPPCDSTASALAIRRWLDRAGRGHALGLFPEGVLGRSTGLRQPQAGVDRLLRRLRALDVPLVPIGIFESQGHLMVRFGRLQILDGSATGLMQAIAAQLPAEMRGQYGRR